MNISNYDLSDLVQDLNDCLERNGYFPSLTNETLIEFLCQEGFVDAEGNITEAGINAGLVV